MNQFTAAAQNTNDHNELEIQGEVQKRQYIRRDTKKIRAASQREGVKAKSVYQRIRRYGRATKVNQTIDRAAAQIIADRDGVALTAVVARFYRNGSFEKKNSKK